MDGMVDLGVHGLIRAGQVHSNMAPAGLVETALRRHEGLLADNGALVALTGKRTGRSPRDRFLVANPASKGAIAWGPINHPIEPDAFARLLEKTRSYLERRELFVFDGWACADPRYRVHVRVVTEQAWHCLFARCLLLRPGPGNPPAAQPQLTIIHAAGLEADPARDDTKSEAFVVLDLDRGLVLIGGTHYAGELKKSVFSYLNYFLPSQGVFPMHCSANVGAAGDTALLFGLSGTGKTTLSADPHRRLIGDDEHGWSEDGIFNFEGGCYAKTIRLSREGEPAIYDAIRFGAVLENVVLDPATRSPDYDNDRFTENTRAAYPVDFIVNAELSGRGGHPRNILFLTCDAFGVLPPLSRLTPAQAQYQFLLGYTAKVAGTEEGITEPQAVFSTCFAAPFLPLPPPRYADLLRQRLQKHQAQVWLVNTGWTGGSYGQGSRIKLAHTRALVHAALHGLLDSVKFTADPIFGLHVPETCPDVPPDLLQPRRTWKNPADYDKRARQLAGQFRENFKTYAAGVAEEVRQAGPK
jgi:phosphoenolpyruvate carboxykinase (ATP)